MLKQKSNNKLASGAVKKMASLARGIAKNSIDGRCFILMHQPKEPPNLAERLKNI